MKKLYLFLLLSLMGMALIAVPMSGVILVGGEMSHYDTLQEVIDAIAENGISGDIEIFTNVNMYFNEPVLISGINQTGDFNILIKANSEQGYRSTFVNDTVTSWQDNYIFKIENSKNITIKGAKFETVVSGYGNMIVLGAGSQNITIDNCVFEGTDIYSSSQHTSVIVGGGVTPIVNNITIKNCKFNNNSDHLAVGGSSSINHSNTISVLNNEFLNGYTSIKFSNTANFEAKGNTVNNAVVGISATHSSGNIEIANNRVNAGVSGIGVNGFNNISSTAKGIYNNIVTVNSSEAAGISIGNGNNMKIYYNSIINYSNHWNAKALSFSGTGHQIKNNSIINYARDAYAFNGINFNSNIFEHNNIYSRARNIARVQNTYYQTIAEFFSEFYPSTNSYNISIDPMFGNDLEDQITESLWIDNKGTFIEGYETDFYGFERSTTSPDIGAIEFTGNPAYTPMSGQYWVGDNEGAAFTTLQDAFDALMIRGVEANTLIKLNRLDGDFTEQLELLTVPGISSQRALFIESNTDHYIRNRIIATGTQEKPYLFKIGRVNHLSIKDVAFDNQSTTYGNGIYFDSYATEITIDNCAFTQASVRSGGDNIHLSDKAMLNNLKIKNTIINSGRFGIYVNNTNSSNITIENSDFTNQNYAVHASNVKNLTLTDNTISGFNNTGILANFTTNSNIERNRIFGSGNGINFSSNSSQQWESGTPYPNLIANNIIRLSSGSSALWLAGNYIDVQHNNIDIKGTNSTGIYQYTQSQYLDIFSNAIRAEKYAVEIVHPVNSENFRMNTNCYFVDGAYIVRFGNNYYYTIGQWKTASPEINQYSIEADPLFNENGYTTSPLMFSRGFGSTRITDDIDGNARDIFPDIGANENIPGIPPTFDYAFDKVLTVGPGKDYESLHDCFYDLERFGFFRWNSEQNHLDTLRVKLDAGTYSDYYTLNHIPKGTNEIEHLGQSWLVIEPANPDDVVIFTYDENTTENLPLLTINGASRVIIKNIRFENTTKPHSKMIDFKGKVSYFEFMNNEFFITENLNYANAIVMQDAYCRNIKLKYNSFENGQYGAYLRTGTYLPKHNWVELSDNTFENTDNPVYVSNIDRVFIYRNNFNDFNYGIHAEHSMGDFNIMHNTFTSNRNPSGGTRALHLHRLNADNENNGLSVLNNVIRINNSNIYTSYGMVLSENNNAVIANNNIIVSQKSILNTSAPVHFSGTTTGVKFFNNLVIGLDKARAFEFNSYSENYFDLISNNCF